MPAAAVSLKNKSARAFVKKQASDEDHKLRAGRRAGFTARILRDFEKIL